MKKILIPFVLLVLTTFSTAFSQELVFGIFADCQYCDCEAKKVRFYKNSIQKLDECISAFNQTSSLSFAVGLGDLIDKNYASFADLKPILKKSNSKIYHVIGNHDYSVDEQLISAVPDELGMPSSYYSIEKGDWLFVFLDGYELSPKAQDPRLKKEADKMLKEMKAKGMPNAHSWNGGIGKKQLQWLTKVLRKANKQDKKALVFCHYPIRPFSDHCLWNSDEVVNILEQSACVKAWFNGHHHSGNYAFENGIHYINIKGMVDTENENAYGIVSLFKDKILIDGYGREEDRGLSIK